MKLHSSLQYWHNTMTGHAISTDQKHETTEVFFGPGASSLAFTQSEDYFAYYGKEVTRITIGQRLSINQDPQPISRLQSKTVQTWKTVSARRNEPKWNIVQHLRSQLQGEDNVSINNYADLTVRLWLVLNVRSTDTLLLVPQKLSICWDMGVSSENVFKVNKGLSKR